MKSQYFWFTFLITPKSSTVGFTHRNYTTNWDDATELVGRTWNIRAWRVLKLRKEKP